MIKAASTTIVHVLYTVSQKNKTPYSFYNLAKY